MDDNEESPMVEELGDTNLKKRPRKKRLFRQILQQMEFYFSDANLLRDRFMDTYLKASKNVPLEVFLRFNRIRALTGSIDDIATALGTSQLLKLTEDGKCVYRTTEVQPKHDREDCTIYIEQLPPDASHEWVKGIFSAYGNVIYVSLPKYKNRVTIKGFAFVEFDTPEAANNALEAFGSAGCCLSPQMPPEELCSVSTWQSEDPELKKLINKTETRGEEEEEKEEEIGKQIKKKKKHVYVSGEIDDSAQLQDKNAEDEPESKKFKTDDDKLYEGEKRKSKKSKVHDEEISHDIPEDCTVERIDPMKAKKGKKRKFENENLENEIGDECITDDDGGEYHDSQIKKKKKNKNLVNQEIIDETQDQVFVTEEETDIDLQVTKKKIKKKKKNKQLQPEGEETEGDMNEVKEDAEDEGTTKRIIKEEENDVDEVCDDPESSEKKKKARKRYKNKKKKSVDKKENDPTSFGLRIISQKEWRRLRNKYLNLQRGKMQCLKKQLERAKFSSNHYSPYPTKENNHQNVIHENKSVAEKTITSTMVPGIIISFDLAEPVGDLKSFKKSARNLPDVVYVDVNEGDTKVYLRCSSSEAAQKLVGDNFWGNMMILEGDAEKIYWDKIWKDRESKLHNKLPVNCRGRDKLLKRAERELGKHIKFDD